MSAESLDVMSTVFCGICQMSDKKDSSKLLAEIAEKGGKEHKPVKEKENPAVAQAKLHGKVAAKHCGADSRLCALCAAAIAKGSKDLEHVDAPKAGLTDAQKAAFLEGESLALGCTHPKLLAGFGSPACRCV